MTNYACRCGVLLFVALLLVVLLPALIFSTLNPALSLNNVESVQAVLALRGTSGSFTLFDSSHWALLAAAGNVTGQPHYFDQLRNNATQVRLGWCLLGST
jgi:hypothetical protein